jgi:lysophospholipid acyltransferase (LPLAT)-like uncharacterized protein
VNGFPWVITEYWACSVGFPHMNCSLATWDGTLVLLPFGRWRVVAVCAVAVRFRSLLVEFAKDLRLSAMVNVETSRGSEEHRSNWICL